MTFAGALLDIYRTDGVVAQLEEHHNGIVGVRGSNPLGSTILRSQRSGERRRASSNVLRASYGWQAILFFMFYTYVLENLVRPTERYIGHTADLKQRLADHNAGKCPHTSQYLSWKLRVYLAFETIAQAQHFERYLKSGSGHAFTQRHFWFE